MNRRPERTNAFAIGVSGSSRQQIVFVTKPVLEVHRKAAVGGLATLDVALWHFRTSRDVRPKSAMRNKAKSPDALGS